MDEIIGEAKEPGERLRRVAAELFAFYDRGGRHLDSDLRERELPAVREWEEHLRGMVTGFVREALVDCQLGDEVTARIAFIFDFPTFNAMQVRGIEPREAAEMVAGMVMSWIARAGPGGPDRETGSGRSRSTVTRRASKRRN